MTPSKEAIEAAKQADDVMASSLIEIIEAAYAIDVEPLAEAYEKLAKRANQLEHLVGEIALLLRKDIEGIPIAEDVIPKSEESLRVGLK